MNDAYLTTVILIYDPGPLGIGSFAGHSAVHIENGGSPILHDPAGSYAIAVKSDPSRFHGCAMGDTCFGPDASVQNFIEFHKANGSRADVFVFRTTREEQTRIAENIYALGAGAPLFCAAAIVNILKGIGPFEKLEKTMLPGRLAAQLHNIRAIQRERTGELADGGVRK